LGCSDCNPAPSPRGALQKGTAIMATLFMPKVTRYYLDGKQVSKDTPGAVKVREESKSGKWYGRYKNAEGRAQEVILCRDEKSARVMVNELETRAQQLSTGVIDRFDEYRQRPLYCRTCDSTGTVKKRGQDPRPCDRCDGAHLSDFREYLLSKDDDPGYVALQRTRIHAVLSGCRFVYFSDLRQSKVMKWLADQRQRGAFGRATSNYYGQAIIQFCNWLVQDGRAPDNPIAYLPKANEELDDSQERRTLLPDEFARLIRAAANSDRIFRRLDGQARAMAYLTAGYTGLRAQELASLTETDLNLVADVPTASVQAAYSKRRRKDVQPIRPDLAAMLQQWIASKFDPDAAADRKQVRLWPGSWWNKAAEMLRDDLAAARLAWIDTAATAEERAKREASNFLTPNDDDGRVLDFHALRHHFISGLAMAGVHPKKAQELARHSDIRLTMDRYTHVGLHEVAADLDKLPELPGTTGNRRDRQELRATGTDGRGFITTKSASSGVILRHFQAPNPTDDDLPQQPIDSNEALSNSEFSDDGEQEAPVGVEPTMADL
jgi:integrase/recombinase XerC